MTPGIEASALRLSPHNAIAYLVERGFDLGDRPVASLLTGGVSGVVVAVEGEATSVVVKQALAELAVDTAWSAPVERATTEARALALASELTPANAPRLLDEDPDKGMLTMSRAPESWANWRRQLLENATDADIAHGRRIGAVLGTWHAATWRDEDVQRSFADDEAFEQLRLDPFHREILRGRPDLQHPLDELIAELATTAECLVHGDYSPKNILIGPDEPWILDYEVARFGAAVFDIAFLLSHLLLKAVHRRDRAPLLRDIGSAFVDAYERTNRAWSRPPTLGWHTAALMLARVEGKSPAPYLTEGDRRVVREISLVALRTDHPAIDELWDRALEEGGHPA